MDAALRDRLIEEHRSLDEHFGHFLAAATGGDAAAAARAIGEFDGMLRRHTAEEEERLLAAPSSRLVAAENEAPRERLHRELRLEHVQVRELSAMIRRLLDERGDVAGALRLAGNLARRWDAHTAREERELFPAD
ncbi:MAG TPA: hypothetical protein VFA98_03010 [Thermoanaerobaculia bacterium]|nr:hypothetical protein [Thermoanaerobaculia bacterium]